MGQVVCLQDVRLIRSHELTLRPCSIATAEPPSRPDAEDEGLMGRRSAASAGNLMRYRRRALASRSADGHRRCFDDLLCVGQDDRCRGGAAKVMCVAYAAAPLLVPWNCPD
jgi:hypothetical protein